MKALAAKLAVVAMAPVAFSLVAGTASAQSLDTFGVLGGSTVTNTGSSVIIGNVGVSPGSAITGFPPGIIVAPYTSYAADGVANLAHDQLVTTYQNYAGQVPTFNLTGQDLGGLILTPGVYQFDSMAQLTGTVTLNGLSNPNAQFVFLIGSTLTTASASSVILLNGAQAINVNFVVGSSATLGTDTTFAGRILALTSITLNTGADIICGAALARNGAVTLDTNNITICTPQAIVIDDVVDDAPPTVVTIADAIDDFIAGGGVLPPEFLALIQFLSADDLQRLLGQFSGEIATAVAPAGMQATGSFLGQIFDRLGDNTTPFPDNRPLVEIPPEAPATVRVLGYGPIETQSQFPAIGPVMERQGKLPDPSRWNAWASVHGDYSVASGDSALGTHRRSITTYSLATGADYLVTPNSRIGIAFSGGRADFDLSDGYGYGHSDVLQAALYGRTEIGAAYVSGALAYAWNDVTTHRGLTLPFGGTERFAASFSAHNIAGRIEAGYRFALPDSEWLAGSSAITPYAALQVQSFHTPAYAETSLSGSNTFALSYAPHTTVATHTEVGARFDHTMILDENRILTLRSRVAWAHDEGGDDPVTAGFQALPGSSFAVYGASGATDSLLLSAGAELRFRNGFSLLGMLDSVLARGSQSYAATGRLSYAW